MAFQHTAGGDTSAGGQFLDEPGWYHLMIQDIQDPPTDKSGTPIPDAAFKVNCSVLAGTVDGQKDKTVGIMFFHPKADGKNEGAFARKKIDRFLIATGFATPAQIEAKESFDIDLQQGRMRQFIAKLDKEEGKRFLELSFADIYHVDDPAVASYPKDADALKLIRPQQRWPGGKPPGKPTASTATASAPAAPTQAPSLDEV